MRHVYPLSSVGKLYGESLVCSDVWTWFFYTFLRGKVRLALVTVGNLYGRGSTTSGGGIPKRWKGECSRGVSSYRGRLAKLGHVGTCFALSSLWVIYFSNRRIMQLSLRT